MSDNVKPAQIVTAMIESGALKTRLSAADLLVRGALAGAFLAFVTSLAFLVFGQTGQFVTGALLFPAGFVLIVLLGLELLTGNFGVIPAAFFAGRASFGGMMRNWVLVFVGNLIGSVFYAALLWIVLTDFGHVAAPDPLASKLRALAVAKTLSYEHVGWGGLAAVFVKAILCNWMVSLGSVVALSSTSTIGKIVAAWLPILIFVEQGFEHAVVNMFAIPMGMMLGAPVSFSDWWLWNQIPVTLGNLVGAFLLTGGTLYFTYGRDQKVPAAEGVVRPATAVG